MMGTQPHVTVAQVADSPDFPYSNPECGPHVVHDSIRPGPLLPDSGGAHPAIFQIRPVRSRPNSQPDCEYPRTRPSLRNFSFQESFYFRSYCRRSLSFISRALKISASRVGLNIKKMIRYLPA